MNRLPWDTFRELPGGPRINFENLCRVLVRRHYGKHGIFHAQANQEGIEFHLELTQEGELGESGQCFGWQCRWYKRQRGQQLGQNRKEKIIDSIEKTEKYFPQVTDWVLWTRNPLTKKDQEEWFFDIDTSMELCLWTEDEIDDLLVDHCQIYREVYFGELVLTPENLQRLHKKQVAPYEDRWMPEVHQPVEAEHLLRRILGEERSWETLESQLTDISHDLELFKDVSEEVDSSLQELIEELITKSEQVEILFELLLEKLENSDYGQLAKIVKESQMSNFNEIGILPTKLRSRNHPAALGATNLLADLNRARKQIDKWNEYIRANLVVVIAEAGCGKTHLSAELTSPQEERPAGILLHGRSLSSRDSLDDLANNITVNGNPIQSMERLLTAVDTAGKRCGRRLPIIIDALNEAEDPRDWKDLLSTLEIQLEEFSHVLVIVTTRPDFVDQAIPDGTERLEIPGFDEVAIEAIKKYFNHFNIKPGNVGIPIQLLKHPLALRLFCEVTNPDQEENVGIEAIPGSLAELFDRYLDQVSERIHKLAPKTKKYSAHDVFEAIKRTGGILWDESTRSIELDTLRKKLNDQGNLWPEESIVAFIEQEGILISQPARKSNSKDISFVYDAMAGHVIAESLIQRLGHEELIEEIKKRELLAENPQERHPLSLDIFTSLVALLPRRKDGIHLWKHLDEPYKTKALRLTADLECDYLDEETIQALKNFIFESQEAGAIFKRLWETRGLTFHPLNADFLDEVLKNQELNRRDLLWSEWLRKNRDEVLKDIKRLEDRWKDNRIDVEQDTLRAKWVMWCLSSTDTELRDHATRALYIYGRRAPRQVFELTVNSLEINDPYISERMLATSYGVCMTKQNKNGNIEFYEEILPEYIENLYRDFLAEDAPNSNTHILARDYARRTVEFAINHSSTHYSFVDTNRITPPIDQAEIEEWGESEDRGSEEYEDGNAPFDYDFRKMLFNRLVEDGGSVYDPTDDEQQLERELFWRIYDLGYSLEDFSEIDKRIYKKKLRRSNFESGYPVNKYGEKYSWIAFYELAGRREGYGELDSWLNDLRFYETDIDPSFPEEPSSFPVVDDDYLGDRSKDVFDWIESDEPPDLERYLIRDEINGADGPWALLDGYITQQEQVNKRDFFTFIRGLICSNENFEELVERLKDQDLGGRWLPDPPEILHIFAGENPWCDTIPEIEIEELDFVIDEETKIEEREVIDLELTDERITDDYEIKIPIIDVLNENFNEINPRNLRFISKEIADSLNLHSKPEKYDLFDSNGQKASININFGTWNDEKQKLLYLRKDLLDSYLENTDQNLIWGIWGERQFYSKGMGIPSDVDDEKQLYKTHQNVITYEDIKCNF